MLSTTKWISGFVIAITLVTKTFISVSAQDCNFTTTKDGKLFLECANVDLDEVPQNYNSSLEIMNISYTGINSFKETDFKNYPKLTLLEMRGLSIKHENGLPDTLWTPLTKLEYLDVTGIEGKFKSFPTKLPASIKYFYINEYAKLEQLDLTMLTNLVDLQMAQSVAKDLPKLSKTAPLVSIDLEKSEGMDNLNYQRLAPYCLLKTLKLDHHTQLTLPINLDRCCGIVIWTQTYRINGVDKNFHCYQLCTNFKLNSDATSEHRDCLVRHGIAISKLWFVVAAIVIGLMLLALLGFAGYRLYSRGFSEPKIDHFVAKEKVEEEENLSITDENSIV